MVYYHYVLKTLEDDIASRSEYMAFVTEWWRSFNGAFAGSRTLERLEEFFIVLSEEVEDES